MSANINQIKTLFLGLLVLSNFCTIAQKKSLSKNKRPLMEYHVSANGNQAGEGSVTKPFRTITEAANIAMPGDVIIVHAGIYRESIVPPRGGNSDRERITYQAAKDGNVIVKGSEIARGWRKQKYDTWMLKLPNSFFWGF